MIRLPFRLTPRSAIELAVALLLAFIGLVLILGTTDEYKAGKAFNLAMDSYSAGIFEDVYDALEDAMRAKPGYSAPREVYAKLLVDEAYAHPAKFAEAKGVFQALEQRQRAAQGTCSLPVLIGLAVADLETVRATNPAPQVLRAAVQEARARLEAALAAYPNSGDIHVNLATVALLENNLPRCRAELDKVVEVGNISPDALPYYGNLQGLAALGEGQFGAAVTEFGKVQEFRPDWEVPQLNLGAAHARMLLAPDLAPRAAEQAVVALRNVVARVKKAKALLYARICQTLGTYYVRQDLPAEALLRFAAAEEAGEMPWQCRFNQAIAQYLNAMAARRRTPESFAAPAAEVALVFNNPQASPRDKFLASCLLGTMDGECGRRTQAIAHFQRAADAAAQLASDPFVKAVLPTVHMSLATLYYESGELAKVAEQLERAKNAPDELAKSKLAAFARLLENAPKISQFEAKLEPLFTEHDLAVSATLAVPASPKPLSAENVALRLIETVSKTAKPLPFLLNGSALYAVAINPPEGRYRVELTLTDAFGARDKATSEIFEIDRDPPRAVDCSPAEGSTVASLSSIAFRLEDSMSAVDLNSLRVMLRYPPGSPLASRVLVSGGKYQFASADGSIARFSAATPNVRAPLPADKFLKGEYRVTVHVQDSRGKARDIEWTFVLNP